MKTNETVGDMYHVCSEGIKTGSLFDDDRSFITGMNTIAFCTLSHKVKILCFCLMDNHVHFIVHADRYECNRFIISYKSRLARDRNGLDKEMKIKIKPITDYQYLMNSIAYVMRNPIAAGFPYMPHEYRWASSCLYFCKNTYRPAFSGCISQMSKESVRKILRTRQHLPDSWTIDTDGMIWPGHYVDYESVNRLFRSPKRFLYYLSVTQDITLMEPSSESAASLRDKELRDAAIQMSGRLFGSASPLALPAARRISLAKELRRELGCSYKQLARVLRLEVTDAM